MIGTDTGDAAARFQAQTTGRSAGERTSRAGDQELELEFVPSWILGSSGRQLWRRHDISGVPAFDDRRPTGLAGFRH